MTLVFDPGEDFAQVADGQEAVTLTRPGSSATSTVHAVRVPIRSRLIAEPGGHYAASDVAWHMRAAELSGEPRSGDVIVDAAGRRWTVLDVEITLNGNCRRCLARNLAVFHGLDAYVDIEQSTLGKGAAGAETRDWQTWKTGLAARIQRIETQVRNEHDRRVTRGRFKIYLAEDVELDRSHRVRGPDAAFYEIVAVRRAERPDSLMEIDAVRAR